MKKFILTSMALALLLFGALGYLLISENKRESTDISSLGETSSGTLEQDSQEETAAIQKNGEELVQEKIEKIRKRLALKGLIIEGDGYLIAGEHTLALKKFLAFYKENPHDSLILKKLGDTYFAMHKYTSALNYYSRLDEYDTNHILSLIYSIDFENIVAIKEAIILISQLDISAEEKLYYTNSLECILDFHNCKLVFGDYFWPKYENTSQSGGQVMSYKALGDMKTAIENYRNFQLEDIHLKNAYIIGSWYKNELYSIAAHLGEQELKIRPDYKPLLKIVAQSYFKLGEYEKARAFLGSYNALDDRDAGIHYMLGIVNTSLREYILANIHLQRSIELGVSDSLLARKALIYNYSLLEDSENLLKSFRNLIENEDYSPEDISLAAYYHILYNSYDWVEKIAPQAQKKFPDDANMYTYLGWIYREQELFEKAQEVLQQGEEVDETNPFLLINIAYNEKDLGNISAALIYFKKTIAAGENTEFALQAKKEISEL